MAGFLKYVLDEDGFRKNSLLASTFAEVESATYDYLEASKYRSSEQLATLIVVDLFWF